VPGTKIATCCYCGSRAALVLRGKERHELSCASCGAPLHEMKMLRSDHGSHGPLIRPSGVRAAPEPARYTPRTETRRPKRTPRRKSFGRWVLEEAWDAIEDIFD
jgi:hypothetical protein